MSKAQAAQIAKRLRDLRAASKQTENPITVPMLARHCQVAVRTAAGWLSAKNPKPMTYQHAIKAAKLFKVEPEWLWDGKEKRPVPDLMGQLTSYDKVLREVEERVAIREVEEKAATKLTDERLAAIEARLEELAKLLGPIVAVQSANDVAQSTPAQHSQSAPTQASSAKRRPAAKRRAGSQ